MKRHLISALGYVLLTTAALAQAGLPFPGPGPRISTGGGGTVPTRLPSNSGSAQNGATNVATISLTLPSPVAAGAACIVSVSYSGSLGTVIATDDKSNTYTLITDLNNTSGGFSLYNFYILNVTNGPQTITATYPTNQFAALQADCFSNVATAAALDGDVMANVNTPPNTANAVTSGPITTTASGDLIYGFAVDITGNGAVAGTGFTIQQAVASAYFSESLIQTTAGSIPATFTANVSGAGLFIVAVVALKHL